METEGLDFGAGAGVAGRALPRDAGARDRGPARRGEARSGASGCSRCWSGPPPTTCACCGSRRRRRTRASTWPRAGWRRARCAPTASASRRTPGIACCSARARAGYSDDELLAAGLASARARRHGSSTASAGASRSRWPTSAGRVLGFGARAMKPDDKPKYLNTSDERALPQGPDRLRRGHGARRGGARPGRVVLVEGYTDVIALHQAGVPEAVAQMGTALTDAAGRRDRPPGAEGAVLPGPGPRRPGVGARRASRRCAAHNKGRSTRGGRVPDRAPAAGPGPGGRGPGRRRARRCARLLETAMPIERFEVERALEVDGPSTDEMLAEAVRIIGPLPVSVLRDELVKFVADRLGINASSSARCCAARRRPAEPQQPWDGRRDGWGDRGGRQWNNGGGGTARRAATGATGTARRLPPPEPSTRAPHSPAGPERGGLPGLLHRAARGGRAAPGRGRDRRLLLLAHDPQGRRSTCASTCATRARNLPSGDEELARLVAKLDRGREPPRGHAGEARARGAAARPAPPRAPHLATPA